MRIAAAVLVLALACAPAPAALPWTRAYVVDERVSALRAAPDLASRVLRRIRTGHMVAIVERRRDRDGLVWLRVAVTRRTRGWVLADAVAAPSDASSSGRMLGLLGSLHGFARLRVAVLAEQRFPRVRGVAADVIEAEAKAAADELTQRFASRNELAAPLSPAAIRAILLTDPLCDRYSRLGVVFDADPTSRVITARQLRR